MPQPVCSGDLRTRYQLEGFIKNYIDRVTDQWLLIAPRANSAMLEMFRDRDALPLRDMVPWAGEFAGKYLTAAAQVLKVSGDRRLKAWLKEFVPLLLSHQAADGYMGPWPKEGRLTNFVSHLGEKGMNTWDTWGHYHIMMGLLLWSEQTRDRNALKAAERIGDLICKRYLGKANPRLVDTGCTEMNLAPVHSLCILYRKTHKKHYLDMALQIVGEFSATGSEGALAGDYLNQALAGKEFFEMPKPRWESLHPVMGFVELYWITGDERYRHAFEHLWWSIVKFDRHNTGGFTSGEKATGNPFEPGAIETCCTIAWIAMSVEMLKLTGNSVVADEIELSTLNSVVGMHSSSGRWATYDTPSDGLRRASAHHIVFQSRAGSPELNCCSVNSPRGFGMLSEWAVMRDRNGILLNYYGQSHMTVPVERGVTVEIIQKTDYPLSGTVDIDLLLLRPLQFQLRLRIPCWSKRTTVMLNGKALKNVRCGRYLEIERRWGRVNRIQIRFDMSFHYWPGKKECEGRTSIYRGPLLLALDRRYNMHLPFCEKRCVRDGDPWKPFSTDNLIIPVLDAKRMKGRKVSWNEWLPPLLLLEFRATDGSRIRLCDYGSAGEGGTPYLSWLPVSNAPEPIEFSRENPLRSCHYR